jgi:hypothetical protein
MAIMKIPKHIETIKSNISSIPINAGQIISCHDTGELFFDTIDGDRIQISDIIYINTEAQKNALLAPLSNKLYLIRETANVYIHDGENWYLLNDQIVITTTLDAANAVSGVLKIKGRQVIPVTMASLVYTTSGANVEDKLKDITKVGIAVDRVAATVDQQKIFTIPFPFPNYLENGNHVVIELGASWLDPERYTISNGNLVLNDTEIGVDNGRDVCFIFVYNSISPGSVTNLDGALITNKTISISKVDDNFFNNICIKTYNYSAIPTTGTTIILVDIPEYNPNTDSLSVYNGTTKLFKGIDYTIDNKNVILTTIASNGSQKFNFEVQKITKL